MLFSREYKQLDLDLDLNVVVKSFFQRGGLEVLVDGSLLELKSESSVVG